MPFPYNNIYWVETANFLKAHIKGLEPLLAPNDFIDIFPGTYPPRCLESIRDIIDFRWIAIHRREMKEISYDFMECITRELVPVFANRVFVIFSAFRDLPELSYNCRRLRSFRRKMKWLEKKNHIMKLKEKFNLRNKVMWCGVVVTTYNRPKVLERCLPQIVALRAPTIVVDDGLDEDSYEWNFRITQKYDIPLLRVPSNRGLPCALNMGISYWLADPKIEWISCFQDDVDVHPTLLDVMAGIQDAKVRPLCTGHDAAEHISYGRVKVGNYLVLMKRGSPGIHLHAHRNYLMSVMPIPTPYLGAPKRNHGFSGQGADEDWWIATWAPHSVAKQGMHVACVPGLVDTFACKPKDSTWGGGKPAFKKNLLGRLLK